MEMEFLALKDLTSSRKGFPVGKEDVDQTEQKENIWIDRRRSTPLKSSEPALPPVPTNRKGGGGPADLAHITPIKHTVVPEPWTPTANLKMLISAVSPDLRDREMRKVLFRPIENEKPASPDVKKVDMDESCQFELADEDDEAAKKTSRKQKSLGLLCQKFLALYPDYPPAHHTIWISLDEVATSLGVERRRIYDIINVLESLAMVGRIAKKSYTWHGRQQLETTLEELQQRGRQQGYHLQMELAAEDRGAGPGCEDDGGEGDASNAGGNRKDKSLRIMSQKFVMLFLVSKTQAVTLDAAAKILIEDSQESSSHSKYKTMVRRLYDIANVLTSLGLIRKVHVREERGRKPAFKWVGPVEFKDSGKSGNASNMADSAQPVAGQGLRGAKMTRHASFNITPTSVAEHRLVNSAPCSPHTELAGLSNQPLDYSGKMRVNSAVCRLQFGSDDRPGPAHQLPSSTPLATPLPHVFPSPSSSPSPQCLAYLPSLSQPSVVMLYGPMSASDAAPAGQGLPASESEDQRKRKREEEDEGVSKKKGMSEAEDTSAQIRVDESQGDGGSEPVQPSHYLYVPNNTGLQSLNFFLPAGQPPANFALPPNGVPTLALPYVLVPSSALPHFPLVAGGLQPKSSDSQAKLSFSLPVAMMSPTHLTLGATPYGLASAAAPDISWPAAPVPSTPEQSNKFGTAAGTPHSPQGPSQTVSIGTPEPLTPHTPNDTTASASKAFFQTPGTLESLAGSVPAARRRGSAQRRLDVGHQAST